MEWNVCGCWPLAIRRYLRLFILNTRIERMEKKKRNRNRVGHVAARSTLANVENIYKAFFSFFFLRKTKLSRLVEVTARVSVCVSVWHRWRWSEQQQRITLKLIKIASSTQKLNHRLYLLRGRRHRRRCLLCNAVICMNHENGISVIPINTRPSVGAERNLQLLNMLAFCHFHSPVCVPRSEW